MKVHFCILFLLAVAYYGYAQHNVTKIKAGLEEVVDRGNHVFDEVAASSNDIKFREVLNVSNNVEMFEKVIAQQQKGELLEENTITANQSEKHIILLALANKIEFLIKTYIKESHTREEKRITLYKIENRLRELIQYHNVMQSNRYHQSNKLSDLIIQGLELTMKKLFESSLRNKDILTFSNDTRFVGSKAIDDHTMFARNHSLIETTFYVNSTLTSTEVKKQNSLTNLTKEIKSVIRSYLKHSNTFQQKRSIGQIIKNKLWQLLQTLVDKYNLNKTLDPEELIDKLIILKLQNMDMVPASVDRISFTDNKTFGSTGIISDSSLMLSKNKTFSNAEFYHNSSLAENCWSNDILTLFGHGIFTGSNTIINDDNKCMLIGNSASENVSKISGNNKTTENKVEEDTTNKTSRNNKENITLDEVFDFFDSIINQTSIDPVCNEKLENVCDRVTFLQNCNCDNGQTVPLSNICDGLPHCSDWTDERNCTNAVGDLVRRTIDIILDIDELVVHKCLPPNARKDFKLFSPAHDSMRKVLEDKWKYYQKTLLKSQLSKPERFPPTNPFNLTREKSDIASPPVTEMISWLLYVWQGDLCTLHAEVEDSYYFEDDFANMELGSLHISDTINNLGHFDWSPQSCSCKHQTCETEECDPRCKYLCWQRYSLNRWECQSFDSDLSISLDLICDGKRDCFDGTDETSCTTDSFNTYDEAVFQYKDILETLESISSSLDYTDSRQKILNLITIVRKLIDRSTKFNVDIHSVKALRDKYFKKLGDIYDDVIQSSHTERLDQVYDLLMQLNMKMVDAMKLSHTGNVRVASSNCYCWNGISLLVHALPDCNVTCEVESKFMKYSCNDNNSSVFLGHICNGIKNCPNENDEINCALDSCGRNHLIHLRLKIKDTKLTLKDVYAERMLNNWKTKTIAYLETAEKKNTKEMLLFQKYVEYILSNLVSVYETLRTTNNTTAAIVLEDFLKIANTVKMALKTCSD